MKNWEEFVYWELATRDTIDVKKIYIDMAGDLVAGILLSQIIYWNLPNKNQKSKLKVKKEGKLWLAKQQTDWWEECRISVRQFNRAIKILEQKEIVEHKNFRFNGLRIMHIHLNHDRFLKLLNNPKNNQKVTIEKDEKEQPEVTKSNDRKLQKVMTESDEKERPLTETTTETTTERKSVYSPNLQSKESSGSKATLEGDSIFTSLSQNILEQQENNLGPKLAKVTDKKIRDGTRVLEKLVRIDGFSLEADIKPALLWAIGDDFWRNQIRSLASLRNKGKNGETKFANLLAQYFQQKQKKGEEEKETGPPKPREVSDAEIEKIKKQTEATRSR